MASTIFEEDCRQQCQDLFGGRVESQRKIAEVNIIVGLYLISFSFIINFFLSRPLTPYFF